MPRAARMLSDPPVLIYGQSFIVKTTKETKFDAVKQFTEQFKKMIFEDPVVVEKMKALLEAHGITNFETEAFNITQDRIARSRLAGDPPDVMLGPKLGQIGLMEFHKAAEAIEIGAEAARRMLPEIRSCFEATGVRR